MGLVTVRGSVGNPRGKPLQEIEFLVDTGAFHSAIPKQLATELELQPVGEITLTLADSRQVKAPVSNAYFRFLDRESIFQVVIADVPKPLLGVTALEGLGLRVDPASGKVEHSRPFGVALL